MGRPFLRFLLLDGFDPDTGELGLRVGVNAGDELGPQFHHTARPIRTNPTPNAV